MFGDRAFQNIAPAADLWNSLPQYLREIDNLDAFKNSWKLTYFCNNSVSYMYMYIFGILHA